MAKCRYGKQGRPSAEWADAYGKWRYYCHGWNDAMTDEPLDVCRGCTSHVSHAQDDLDRYNEVMNGKLHHA